MPFRDVLGQPLVVELLRRGLSRGRLHHALLFFGPDGVGKELVAFAVACALVCTEAPGEGCGVCSACHRALSRSSEGAPVPLHPDVLVVERGLYPREVLGRTTDEKTDISVDQIRRVVLEKVAFAPHEARERIFIVRRAEEMSIGAANALLKTLEEPPAHTRFILLTAHPGELLSTIRSRAQPIRFSALADDVLVSILEFKGVAPAKARAVAPLAGGSVETALTLVDPAEARAASVSTLRKAASASLSVLLEATGGYANSGDERRRLHDDLLALGVEEATEVRRLVLEGGDPRAIDAALARYSAARDVSLSLDRNANVPLALEGAWLALNRAIR